MIYFVQYKYFFNLLLEIDYMPPNCFQLLVTTYLDFLLFLKSTCKNRRKSEGRLWRNKNYTNKSQLYKQFTQIKSSLFVSLPCLLHLPFMKHNICYSTLILCDHHLLSGQQYEDKPLASSAISSYTYSMQSTRNRFEASSSSKALLATL